MAIIDFNDTPEAYIASNDFNFQMSNLDPNTNYNIKMGLDVLHNFTTLDGNADILLQDYSHDTLTFSVTDYIGSNIKLVKDSPYSGNASLNETITLATQHFTLEDLFPDTDYFVVIADNFSGATKFTTSVLTIPEPDSSWSLRKKIQYYLDIARFDTGGVDGKFGAKSASSLVILQKYFNIQGPLGIINQDTYLQVKDIVERGYKLVHLQDFIANWSPQASSVDQSSQSNNGHLQTNYLSRIPTSYYDDTLTETSVLIGWAMMVFNIKDAVDNNGNPYNFDLDKLLINNDGQGYRPYHNQVEAYITQRLGNGYPDASEPTFTYGGNTTRSTGTDAKNVDAENWITTNWSSFTNDSSYNDVPDSLTVAGALLEGYGWSNHGWGLALDMKLNDGGSIGGGEGYPQTALVKWLQDNGLTFGFDGYYIASQGTQGGYKYHKETWHWNYIY